MVPCAPWGVLKPLGNQEGGDVHQPDDTALESLGCSRLFVEALQCSPTGHTAEAMSDHDNVMVLNELCDSFANNLDVVRPIWGWWSRSR